MVNMIVGEQKVTGGGYAAGLVLKPCSRVQKYGAVGKIKTVAGGSSAVAGKLRSADRGRTAAAKHG